MNGEFLQTDQERRKRVLELLEAAEKNLAYTSQLSGQLAAGAGAGQNGGLPAVKEAPASPADPAAGNGADLPPAPERRPAPLTWMPAPERAQRTDEGGGQDLEGLSELARTLRMMSQRAAVATPHVPEDTAQEQAADAPFDQKQPALPMQGSPEPDTARIYFPLLEKEEDAAAVTLEGEQTQAAGLEKETPPLSGDNGPKQAIEETMLDLTVNLEQEQAAGERKKKGKIRRIKTEKKGGRRRRIARFLFAAAAVAALTVLLTQFWGIAIVQGSSMNPSIAEKDLVIFTRRPKDIRHGDIVIIQYDNELIVKRVAGLPEDVIEVDEQGYILRNGERVQGESAIYGQANITGDIQFPVQVQAGHYFVLGDNRPVSLDSRTSAVGQIAQQDILGEVVSWLHME